VDSQGYDAVVNTQFQKIGARGLTILVASGDSGTNGRTDGNCVDPYLKPDFPACSPFVTSVGGTQVNNAVTNVPNPPPVCNTFQCISGGDEVAVSYDVSSFASGGGFSVYSVQPAYQAAAVAAYWKTGVHMPDASYFNKTNRGFPDVAALGHDCMIYEGQDEQVGGTSCAAPIWAAITGVLNQYSMKRTGKPLGFLNPWLYKVYADCKTCFQDITVGDNICTENGCQPTCEGFECAAGWDPVTGLGSPNVANLIKYIQTH
jgi:subtilase family serine protease